MLMFRAVPKKDFDENKIYTAQKTRRTPSNVPYLVDNLWEFLRPDHFPSRRFSAYASPTPDLALQNASAVGNNENDYVVTQVVFNTSNIKLAHIEITDARYHKDIQLLMRKIINFLGKDFSNLSVKEKIEHAVLFLPSVSKEELNEYFSSSPEKALLAKEIKEMSSFWNEASNTPMNHNGELFFEITEDITYQLKKV